MKIRESAWLFFFVLAFGFFSCNSLEERRDTAVKEDYSPPRLSQPLEQPRQGRRLFPLNSYRKGIVEIGGKRVRVFIADSPRQQQEGLMFVKPHELGQNEGMLFLFPDDAIRSFWMKNTEFPLDIAFIDVSGKIVRIHTMKPFDESSYSSDYPARYALELHAGWLARNDVEVGDTVKFLQIR